MRKRVIEIDMARGLATLAVILIHITADPLIASCRQGWLTLLYMIPNVAARFAVPTFVVLSGTGLALSSGKQEGYFSFLWRRLSKLLPGYLVWSLIYELTYDKTAGVFSLWHHVTPGTVVHDLFTGSSCFHLYFVPIVIQLYIVYPLTYRLVRTRIGLAACCLVSFGMICLARFVEPPESIGFLFDYANPINWVGYFAVGIWLARDSSMAMLRNHRHKMLISSLLLGCLGIMTWLVYRSAVVTNRIDPALEGIEPLVIPYTLLLIAWAWSRNWTAQPVVGFLGWVSKYSYGVYLSHVLVLIVAFEFIFRARHASFGIGYGIGQFAIVVPAAMLLSYAGSVLGPTLTRGFRQSVG